MKKMTVKTMKLMAVEVMKSSLMMKMIVRKKGRKRKGKGKMILTVMVSMQVKLMNQTWNGNQKMMLLLKAGATPRKSYSHPNPKYPRCPSLLLRKLKISILN